MSHALSALYLQRLYPLRSIVGVLLEAYREASGYARRDEAGDIPAKPADFFDEARRDELVAVGRHQEDSFHLRIQTGVHAGHLELVFEVGNRSEAADDDGCVHIHREMHQQAVEGTNLDLGAIGLQCRDILLDHLNPLLGGEQRSLPRIASNANDQMVQYAGGALDDIHVAVGHRVEGPGVDTDSLAHLSPPTLTSGLSSHRRAIAAFGDAIIRFGFLGQPCDRNYPFALRNPEQGHPLGLTTSDPHIMDGHPDHLAAVGYQHYLMVIRYRERGDYWTVALIHLDIPDTLPTPAGHPVLIR